MRFISWFSPLTLAIETYHSGSAVPETVGYRIDEIADIVEPPWFFGFMAAEDAKRHLASRPYGSFLFRFSSQVGQYALSVNYGQVGHWRINAEKRTTAPAVFLIDGRGYRSLHHIIETHQGNRDPLIVKGGPIDRCFLRDPVLRDETQ